MKKLLLNFAHPLSEKAKAQIKDIEGEFEEIEVACQFDLDQSLCWQIGSISANAEIRLQNADMIIAPALSSAAALLMRDHVAGQSPKVVWLKKEGFPPEFILGGIE